MNRYRVGIVFVAVLVVGCTKREQAGYSEEDASGVAPTVLVERAVGVAEDPREIVRQGDVEPGSGPVVEQHARNREYPDRPAPRRVPVLFADSFALPPVLISSREVARPDGWFPPNAPIQVRFELRAELEYGAELRGEAVVEGSPPRLSLDGTPNGGRFHQSIGLRLEARVRWDFGPFAAILGVPGLPVRGEKPIADVPQIDVACLDAATTFTPFLLAGSPTTTATLRCRTARTEVWRKDLLEELLVDASDDVRRVASTVINATLRVFLTANMIASMEGVRVEIGETGEASVDRSGKAVLLPTPRSSTSARYVARRSAQASFILTPEITLGIAGTPLVGPGDGLGIDLPIEFPPAAVTWSFRAVPIPVAVIVGRLGKPTQREATLAQADPPFSVSEGRY
jgi:hypothetical protein